MIIRLFATTLLLAGLAGMPAGAAAQDARTELRLEEFVDRVARLWADADVAALVDLVPRDDKLILDAGSGTEVANSRHAAAALRALFTELETTGARTVTVTVASTDPLRGFGELAWTFRTRGAPGEQSRSVYLAALQEDGIWHITELRLLP